MAKDDMKIEIEGEEEKVKEKSSRDTARKRKVSGTKEVEELRKKLDSVEKERSDLKDRMLRLHAETENFKKRIIKEKEDFVRFSNEKTVRELLPVVDNLERAVAHAREAEEESGLIEGVEMTLTLFNQALDRLGVSQISAVGEPFDPGKHEAIQQIESDEHEPNVVISEFQKGYMLNERLIRPAMVVVSKQPAKK